VRGGGLTARDVGLTLLLAALLVGPFWVPLALSRPVLTVGDGRLVLAGSGYHVTLREVRVLDPSFRIDARMQAGRSWWTPCEGWARSRQYGEVYLAAGCARTGVVLTGQRADGRPVTLLLHPRQQAEFLRRATTSGLSPLETRTTFTATYVLLVLLFLGSVLAGLLAGVRLHRASSA
jgi:hypothetical protein